MYNGLLRANISTGDTKILRFLPTTLLWLAMKDKDQPDQITAIDAFNDRLQILEEKFLYQDQTIDALNDVIIEQQAQLNLLEDQILRLQALLSTVKDNYDNGEDPPPPHY